MGSNVPIVRQIAWVYFIPHVIFIFLLSLFFDRLGVDASFLCAAWIYLILILLLRNTVASKHTKGIRLIKQQRFEDAIPLFEHSVVYFNRNAWIDKYRFVTLLSLSKMSYKEMGLCNIAFCYSQTNNGQKAKACYEEILKEYPKNGIAIAALKMLTSQ